MAPGMTSQNQKRGIFSHFSREGRGVRSGVNDYTMGKLNAIPIAQVVETFQVGEQVEVLGRVANPVGTEAPCPLVPHTLPYTPFPLYGHLYP